MTGTPPHMLHRRDAPDTSVDAAHSIDTNRLETMVLEAIKEYGQHGCIGDDLVQRFCPPLAYSSISARFCALERKGLIVYCGDKRKGRSNRKGRVMRCKRPAIK